MLGFTTTEVDAYKMNEYLKKRKNWQISSIHLPKGLHVSVTLANCENVRKHLANDVRETIQALKDANDTKETTTSAIYGASSTVPSEDLGDKMLQKLLSVSYR